MKNLFCISAAIASVGLASAGAESLFGSGTITIATNEAILINTIANIDEFYIDGTNYISQSGNAFQYSPRFALAGPHTLVFSNSFNGFITFQRIQGSAMKSTVVADLTTNVINVPAGKTVQFFARFGSGNFDAQIYPLGSTNQDGYALFGSFGYYHPTVTGPVTIKASASYGAKVLTYYLTDEVLQLPPSGFLGIPAPKLEIDVEKSYDLTNWVPNAAFNTEAEAGAFYRLRILK